MCGCFLYFQSIALIRNVHYSNGHYHCPIGQLSGHVRRVWMSYLHLSAFNATDHGTMRRQQKHHNWTSASRSMPPASGIRASCISVRYRNAPVPDPHWHRKRRENVQTFLPSLTNTAKTVYRKFEANISRNETPQSQSQFLNSCFCERFIYSHARSAYSAAGKKEDLSWDYINHRSQKHEGGNWDWGCAVSFLGVHKSHFLSSENIRKFPAIKVFYLLNAKASCFQKWSLLER